jgi:hypothetical protein
MVPEAGQVIAPARSAAVAARVPQLGPTVPAAADVTVDQGTATVHLVSGTEVRLGRPVQLAVKLRAAGAVLDHAAVTGAPQPAYVDVSVPTNPVTG